ncbi:DUF1847 domain-containing protein [Methanolobus profundi]|uniref:Uncharacterized metal-binding protein n=1 Tax=Methanolobus profundi TaxID=487685 RepID=A0A1I4NS68_9EURY|nr:DUF1847 domain-containing protein [Methanolobus profundi]SFM18245.1 Uncharacterized metal-binding protein [Methanolobus profundi]
MKCARCDEKLCREGKDCAGITDNIDYSGDELGSMRTSAAIEARYYMEKTRLEEIILYAKEMGYKRLGLAFCVGMEKEAEVIQKILEKYFDVYSVCCKVSAISKEDYGLEKLHPDSFDPTCNPIGQAMLLGKKDTQLNLIIGLCIGHDILFTQHSAAPVTTFIVKDRVLAHNPAGAIYSGYYLKKTFGIDE